MKVLFVLNESTVEPLGPMYLAANCEAECDAVFVSKLAAPMLQALGAKRYDAVAFSTITGSHLWHNELAGMAVSAVEYPLAVIMGGPHPTFFPAEALALSNIDYICVGEGISAFARFVNGKPSLNIHSKKSLSGFKTLEPLVDLATVKPPNRDWIYKYLTKANNPIKNFMGSFGCPFHCTYCFNDQYAKLYPNEKVVRYFAPEEVTEQMVLVKRRYPFKLAYIQDDTFIINKSWFFDVTDLMKRYVNVPYHCHIRCDLLTEDIVWQLRATGCRSVTFAVEHWSDVYRRLYLNRSMRTEKIVECVNRLHNAGIIFRIENMIGLPDSGFLDSVKTLRLNRLLRPTVAWASLYQPYPNTPLAKIAENGGQWNGDIDSICNSFFDKSPLNMPFKYAIENLQKLFSFGGKGLWHYWVAIILSWLPFGKWYSKIYRNVKKKGYKKLYGV
jgi:anaerobic magnesium-protoporphyrin IX monomethyl ester cyclase